jgi:uncharacterized membrane protein YfcA
MVITLIVFLAIFTQAVSGFGLALVSMPLLVSVVGVQTATPLVALFGGLAELLLLAYYRQALNVKAIARLTLASLVGVPVGVFFLKRVDAEVFTAVLGAFLVGYAFYALFTPKLPQLSWSVWAYLFGFAGGVLGGAYNTSGPPVIVYGTCRRWSGAQFKGNLQGFFLLTSIMAFITHLVNGNFTAVVWQNFWLSLPGIGLGLFLGFKLDKYLNPERFRQVVLILLIVLGLRLIF